MIELVRSKSALTIAAVAATLWALGSALHGLGYALLSSYQSEATVLNLLKAGQWLSSAAGFAVLCATCFVAWTLFVTRKWSEMWEVSSTALATLILVIGLLLAATQAPDPSDAAHVIAAIGLGGWGVVIVVGAARRALLEQEDQSLQHQARLRLAGAAAVFVLAIANGLPSASLSDTPLAVTNAALALAGYVALILVLSVARTQRMIVTKKFSILVLGLGGLALAALANAISSGIVYGSPTQTVLSLRIGLSIPHFVEGLALVALAWAAFGRIGELAEASALGQAPISSLVDVDAPVQQPGGVPSTGSSVPPSWQPDPSLRHEQRWWDGERWTEHVVDAGRPSTDPAR